MAICAGVAVPLLLLELVLRVFVGPPGAVPLGDDPDRDRAEGAWIASDDPVLAYVHRPHARFRGAPLTESRGILRPEDVAAARTPGVARIVVVGDSVGAAFGLPYGERFPDRLERALRASRAPCEVLNLCVDGYDTEQAARRLEALGPALAPDAVVVACCLNDTMVSPLPLQLFRPPERPASFAFDFLAAGAARLAGRAPARETMPLLGPSGPAADVWRRAYDPSGEGWRAAEAGLDRIARWSAPRRVPVLFAIVPLLLPGDPAGAATAAFRRQWASAARARSFGVIDLQAALSSHPVASLRWMDDDVYHFSSAGHAAIADALVAHARGLIAR